MKYEEILTAQLRLRDGSTLEPALFMRGKEEWLLTLVAMLFETMKREGDLTHEEALKLLNGECFNLAMERYRVNNGTIIIDGTRED